MNPALRHVLIVDDSEPDRLFARIVLERGALADRITECDGVEAALRQMHDPGGVPVDLVLLDINMPGADGFDFLARHPTDGAPVVMLSASPDPADRERAAAHPAVRGYLVKPIALDAGPALQALLGGASSAGPQPVANAPATPAAR